MSRWDELFERMRRVEAERLEVERQVRDAEAARRRVDAWADAVMPRLWQALLDEIGQRVHEFALATGRRINVTARDDFGWTTVRGSMRVIELQLDESVVYLYSHRVPGALPLFHVAHWLAVRSGRRNANRMMSMPLCMVERNGIIGYRLRRTAPQSPDPIAHEDVVYRAFELLVFGLGRPDVRLLALQTASRANQQITRLQFETN